MSTGTLTVISGVYMIVYKQSGCLRHQYGWYRRSYKLLSLRIGDKGFFYCIGKFPELTYTTKKPSRQDAHEALKEDCHCLFHWI